MHHPACYVTQLIVAGWGTTSLTASAEAGDTAHPKVAVRAASQSKVDMFSVLQLRNPQNQPDAWFGNAAIDPSAGKKSVTPPPDPKGRKNLFQVQYYSAVPHIKRK
jgi:hypothetical protein